MCLVATILVVLSKLKCPSEVSEPERGASSDYIIWGSYWYSGGRVTRVYLWHRPGARRELGVAAVRAPVATCLFDWDG